MTLGLCVEILPGKTQVKDERCAVTVRVLIRCGFTEGIADLMPDDGLALIADQSRCAEMIGMDVVGNAVADSSDGSAAEIEVLFACISCDCIIDADQLAFGSIKEMTSLSADGLDNPLAFGVVGIGGDGDTVLPDLGKAVGLVIDIGETVVLDQVAGGIVRCSCRGRHRWSLAAGCCLSHSNSPWRRRRWSPTIGYPLSRS